MFLPHYIVLFITWPILNLQTLVSTTDSLIFIFVAKSFWSYRGRKNQGPGLRGSNFFSLQDLRRCISSRLSNVWDRLKQEQQSFSDKSRAVSALNSFRKVLEVFHLKRIAKLCIFFFLKRVDWKSWTKAEQNIRGTQRRFPPKYTDKTF